MLIPHRIAIELIERGWICRNDNIWQKTNPMCESVTDRRTTSFEFFFHFTKEGQYYYDHENAKTSTGANQRDVFSVNTASYPDAHFAVFPKEVIKPFIKSSCPEGGVVLDPFIGSGTTAVVAEELDRDWIGIDLNKDYVDMSYDRIENETKKIFDDRSVFDY
jgi:site-specific DNA-methyltransferase (adenine-specific)